MSAGQHSPKGGNSSKFIAQTVDIALSCATVRDIWDRERWSAFTLTGHGSRHGGGSC